MPLESHLGAIAVWFGDSIERPIGKCSRYGVETVSIAGAGRCGVGRLWVFVVDRRLGQRQSAGDTLSQSSFWAESHLRQYAVVVPALDRIVVNRLDEGRTKRTIHKRQMVQQVRMVVEAAPKN